MCIQFAYKRPQKISFHSLTSATQRSIFGEAKPFAMKYAVFLLALMFAGIATPSMAQKAKPKPLSQAYKTSNKGYECYAVTTREECEKCEAKGEYGQVSTPKITCSKCENVSNAMLAKFPCSSCSNTRKVKDPNYVPPRKCEVCNGRGLVLTLGHKIQVADADYTEMHNWNDAQYACSNFGGRWRLPTKEELTGMYEFLHRKGKGNFQNTSYWSSSEMDDDAELALYLNFENGEGNSYNKNDTRHVRVVRTLPSMAQKAKPVSVEDIDGNQYEIVKIGSQYWFKSNLKVSKYRNRDTIPTWLSNSAWLNTNSGAYAIYDNDPVNDGLYGKLYNYYAVTDSRGLCPTGWHVPSDGDWNILVKYLDPDADTACSNREQSSIAGGALKSTAMKLTRGGWNSPNEGATNSSGFTALPGGFRWATGGFSSMTGYGYWWSSSVSSGSDAWGRGLYSSKSVIVRSNVDRAFGFSVRCLKDTLPTVTTTSVTGIKSTGATTGGNVTANGGASVTARGVAYGTAENPTTANSITSNGTGTGAFTSTLSGLTSSTLYYVRAYATNAVGTAFGNEVSFYTQTSNGFASCGSVSDIDGNTYQTVQIGTQCWTQSNLKVGKYRNGNSIPTGLRNSAWKNTTSGAYTIYDNDPVNDGLYGKLYNYYAVTDSRGLCPTGWHVPTDAEWTTLENQLGGSSAAGGALKSTAIKPTPGGWKSPNTGATNSSGFTALPGGLRFDAMPGGLRLIYGNFVFMSSDGYWWSSTVRSGSFAWLRTLKHDGSAIDHDFSDPPFGLSVRCCRD
ncbi:MAG: DUF1566 domain-containing protein [Bacteroidetes bacterium]|nr:DUF1566 domain-containing protein [Bacteroidota bacterium]